MTPERMLRVLSEHGEDAASDYNDALDGWFGWQVTDDLLSITFQAEGSDQTTIEHWRLVPGLDGDTTEEER